MKTTSLLFLAVTITAAATSGCARQTEKPKEPAAPAQADREATSIPASLAKLGPEDRNLADEQVFCAVQSKNPLGSMGVPHKVMIGGQPVFLCCDACETRAKAHVDRTLAKVQELKEANAKKSEKK